jgi:hypothetical protein
MHGRRIGDGASCHQVLCGDHDRDAGTFDPFERRACASDTDCESGRHCIFAPGCGSTGRCSRPDNCSTAIGIGMPPTPGTSITVCGCDGTPRSEPWQCGIKTPYAHVGACP